MMKFKKRMICITLVWSMVLASTIHFIVPARAATKSWKKLYAEYLEKLPEDSFPRGRFLYINNDNIPELFLEGICAAAGNRLLTIYHGKVYEHYISGHGAIMYLEKKNRYYTFGGHMDSYFDDVGKLSKGKMVSIANGTYGAEDNSNVKLDENGEPIYRYYWNGKEVTKKAYEKKLNASLGKNRKKYKDAYIYEDMDVISDIKKLLES